MRFAKGGLLRQFLLDKWIEKELTWENTFVFRDRCSLRQLRRTNIRWVRNTGNLLFISRAPSPRETIECATRRDGDAYFNAIYFPIYYHESVAIVLYFWIISDSFITTNSTSNALNWETIGRLYSSPLDLIHIENLQSLFATASLIPCTDSQMSL